MSRPSGAVSKSKDERFKGKPLVDPRTGRGQLWRQRILKVLSEDPEIELWQVAERFGVDRHTIEHYRETLKLGRPMSHRAGARR